MSGTIFPVSNKAVQKELSHHLELANGLGPRGRVSSYCQVAKLLIAESCDASPVEALDWARASIFLDLPGV